ncbi:3'-5' exonuclease [Betaproteobacteria bacterium GR16-43]|nr:3'-5' exonuclease [Betaproteobacteria bacterium GR16-43]
MAAPILVFDIETVPDVAGLRKLWELADTVSDDAVVDLVSQRRRQATGSDFLPTHLQRIVAISCVLRAGAETLRVWSVGTPEDGERELVKRFFEGVDKYVPTLVSWNGSSFDLPVLHYRALFHGVQASAYWDLGEENKEFKWNNYISRWHLRHTDLMDVLAGYQNRAWAPLNEIAVLCGLPGKLGMDGSQVWPAYKRGELDAIRNYCETDVANTYLLYLRFQHMRGAMGPEAYEREVALFKTFLAAQPAPHWKEFSAAWK